MPVKDYLALKNVQLPKGGLILTGLYQDTADRCLWHRAENLEVPPETNLMAGTVFRADIGKGRETIWRQMDAVTGSDDSRHFDLETVLGEVVDYAYGDTGHKATLADVLRSHQIYTLEEVAADATGSIPFSERVNPDGSFSPAHPIRVSDILSAYADAATVQAWIEAARRIVAQDSRE